MTDGPFNCHKPSQCMDTHRIVRTCLSLLECAIDGDEFPLIIIFHGVVFAAIVMYAMFEVDMCLALV